MRKSQNTKIRNVIIGIRTIKVREIPGIGIEAIDHTQVRVENMTLGTDQVPNQERAQETEVSPETDMIQEIGIGREMTEIKDEIGEINQTEVGKETLSLELSVTIVGSEDICVLTAQ
jgi:hypothetical protein